MLLRYLKIDVRRAFGNWRFPICVIIISVLLLYNKDEPADVVSWMNHVNTMQLLFIAMGIASVPYVGSYIDDNCHKFRIQMELRSNHREYYIISKMLVVFISTQITFILGFLITLQINYIRLGMPDETQWFEILDLERAYMQYLKEGRTGLYFAVCIFHMSVLAGFMSLLGLFVSEFVNNKIAAYTFPLLCVYVQDILMQRLLGWQRGAVISWKALGVNQLEMTLSGQQPSTFFFQIQTMK